MIGRVSNLNADHKAELWCTFGEKVNRPSLKPEGSWCLHVVLSKRNNGERRRLALRGVGGEGVHPRASTVAIGDRPCLPQTCPRPGQAIGLRVPTDIPEPRAPGHPKPDGRHVVFHAQARGSSTRYAREPTKVSRTQPEVCFPRRWRV